MSRTLQFTKQPCVEVGQALSPANPELPWVLVGRRKRLPHSHLEQSRAERVCSPPSS